MPTQTLGIRDWIEIALKYEGTPAGRYLERDVSNKPGLFDCSGYVQHVLLEAGFSLPNVPETGEKIRHSEEFFDYFGFSVHAEAVERGDLVFSSRHGVFPTHIGFCLGNGMIIHSPGRDNTQIAIEELESVFGGAIKYDPSKGKQHYFRNPIGFKRPALKNQDGRRHTILNLEDLRAK